MVRRYELTDPQFALIEDLLPANGRRGGQWNDHRTTLNGIFWLLHTGAQWRELPERYGNWKTVYDRFRPLAQGRHLRPHPGAAAPEARRSRAASTTTCWCVDATSIRASRAAAGASRKKGCRRAGRPRPGPLPGRLRDQAAPDRRRPRHPAGGRGHAGPGARVEARRAGAGGGAAAPPGRGRPRRRPRRLAGDKGYSYPRIRRYLRRRGIKAVIPTRKDQRRNPRFDKETYRRRNVVERCVNWLKESRRLGTRHEKLAVNFLAMVKLAMIRRCLTLLDSSDRP